jgi:hypothetical protein
VPKGQAANQAHAEPKPNTNGTENGAKIANLAVTHMRLITGHEQAVKSVFCDSKRLNNVSNGITI